MYDWVLFRCVWEQHLIFFIGTTISKQRESKTTCYSTQRQFDLKSCVNWKKKQVCRRRQRRRRRKIITTITIKSEKKIKDNRIGHLAKVPNNWCNVFTAKIEWLHTSHGEKRNFSASNNHVQNMCIYTVGLYCHQCSESICVLWQITAIPSRPRQHNEK